MSTTTYNNKDLTITRPWTIEGIEELIADAAEFNGTLDNPDISDDESERIVGANAALIVNAVNHHDQLVARIAELEAALRGLRNVVTWQGSKGYKEALSNAMAFADAALNPPEQGKGKANT